MKIFPVCGTLLNFNERASDFKTCSVSIPLIKTTPALEALSSKAHFKRGFCSSKYGKCQGMSFLEVMLALQEKCRAAKKLINSVSLKTLILKDFHSEISYGIKE